MQREQSVFKSIRHPGIGRPLQCSSCRELGSEIAPDSRGLVAKGRLCALEAQLPHCSLTAAGCAAGARTPSGIEPAPHSRALIGEGRLCALPVEAQLPHCSLTAAGCAAGARTPSGIEATPYSRALIGEGRLCAREAQLPRLIVT